MDSIGYYNKNAQGFYDRTVNAAMDDVYEKFLKRLPLKCRILDAGCGIGRDAKFFLNNGYDVSAFDASEAMVEMASKLTGKSVLHLLYHEMHFSNEFDAVFANASLLHTPYEELKGVLQRFHRALRPSGILYASFKYGSSMRQADNRTFFDMNEAKIMPFLEGMFEPLEIWKRPDTVSRVAPSPDKAWLCLIAKRI